MVIINENIRDGCMFFGLMLTNAGLFLSSQTIPIPTAGKVIYMVATAGGFCFFFFLLIVVLFGKQKA